MSAPHLRTRLGMVVVVTVVAVSSVGMLLVLVRSGSTVQPTQAVVASSSDSPATSARDIAKSPDSTSAVSVESPDPQLDRLARVTTAATNTTNMEDATEFDILALVNEAPISLADLDLARTVDQVMAALSGLTPTADDVIVEQLINGELVLQAMDSASSVGDDAEGALTALLATYDRSAGDLDELLATAALDRKDFDRYFARLVNADAFARVQASDSGISVEEYVQALQQNAYISYGPLATQLISTKLDSSDDAPSAAQPTSVVTENKETDQPIAEMAVTPPIVDAKPVVEEPFGTEIGQLAPQFQLQSLTESAQPLTLDDLRGQPLVLSFWTTWCPYCLRQTPVLVAGYEQYADQGIAFVGIDVQEQASTVQQYLDQHGIAYPILLDRDGAVAATYAVGGYPTTYFLDRDGRIVAKQVGTLSAEQLTQHIDQIDQE